MPTYNITARPKDYKGVFGTWKTGWDVLIVEVDQETGNGTLARQYFAKNWRQVEDGLAGRPLHLNPAVPLTWTKHHDGTMTIGLRQGLS